MEEAPVDEAKAVGGDKTAVEKEDVFTLDENGKPLTYFSLPSGGMIAVLNAPGHLVLPEKLLGFNPGQETLLRNRAAAGYHLSDGMCFKRLDDGTVRIHVNRPAAGLPPDGTTPFSRDIDAESWATVLEEMSGAENSMKLHQAARDLHA